MKGVVVRKMPLLFLFKGQEVFCLVSSPFLSWNCSTDGYSTLSVYPSLLFWVTMSATTDLHKRSKSAKAFHSKKQWTNRKKFVANYFSKLLQSLICWWYLKNIHTQKHSDQTFLIPSTSKIQILLINNVLSTEKLVYFFIYFWILTDVINNSIH